jgi:hypothetical protein
VIQLDLEPVAGRDFSSEGFMHIRSYKGDR